MNISNVGDVVGFLEACVDSFDFKRVGIEGWLGDDVKMKVVKCIYDRSLDTKGGISGHWDKNEPKYRAWKEKKYGIVDDPNVRTGQMLSQKSLDGRSTRSKSR